MANLDVLLTEDLSRSARRVLVTLMSVVNDDGSIVRPIPEIRTAGGIGQSAWFQGAAELEERGLLTRRREGFTGSVRCTLHV